MHIYDVKFTDISNNGQRFYILFGTHHKTIDELTKDLQDNHLVAGIKLRWHREGQDFVIDDQFPVCISKTSIYSISLPAHKIVRYEE